jgi:hypothetical protein
MNLVLGLLALALGPILYGLCQKKDLVRSALDGLMFVTIAGIVIVHIVPDVYNLAGITALLFMAAGAGVAFLVERQSMLANGDRYAWIILLGTLGLVIHAMMDGIALLPGDHLHSLDAEPVGGHDHDHDTELGLAGLLSNHLALGVILHRIPIGMAIWWTIRPRLGSKIAIGALVIIVLATSAAYLLGKPVVALMEVKSFAYFQAFVAGTLLHVIVFSSEHSDSDAAEKRRANVAYGERLGVIVGLILVFLVPHAH